MWKILAALFLAAGAQASCQVCVDGPRPHAIADQPLGARCKVTAECAAGLTCIEDYCTISCSGAPTACPSGSSCIFDRLCLPGCSTDEDCLLGSSVATCVGPSPPSPAYCFNAVCKGDGECPPQGRCVGVSKARGITWNDTCRDGFCQR